MRETFLWFYSMANRANADKKKKEAIDYLSPRATKFESLNLKRHRIWIENRIMEIMKDYWACFTYTRVRTRLGLKLTKAKGTYKTFVV